ncbi:MAG: FixH family protein, partial [Hyphomonadaceae bacterium]
HQYRAQVAWSGTGGARVTLAGEGELPGTLKLSLVHPTHARFDEDLPLVQVAAGEYVAAAARDDARVLLAGSPRWYVRLQDDAGNWRLNAGGVDLNRDWGAFSQPETKALSQWIIAAAGGRRVVSMMDFHSTDKTVIYAPPPESASPTIAFLPFLKTAFDTTLSAPPEWNYAHNPNGGTSKGWALEALKAPGITVELWDQIPANDARKLGATAADALIDYFAK